MIGYVIYDSEGRRLELIPNFQSKQLRVLIESKEVFTLPSGELDGLMKIIFEVDTEMKGGSNG